MGVYDLGTARGTIKITSSGLTTAGTALRKLGVGLIGVGGLAVAGFGVAVKQAADFEKIMSGAQSALGATKGQMESVKKVALELGANSIYGAKNVGKAIEALAYAGLSIKEITGGAAKATIDLAQASGGLIDLDTAGTTVVNTMRTFGLTAKDAAHIADELAGAANRSTIDIRDIVTSLRYVGPVANSAGIGLDSVSQALALLGDRGIRGSTAGTSLRGVMLGLISPSLKAKGVLKDLGIITADGSNIMFDATGKMKDFGEVAQILQDHTRGLSKEQKEAAFSTIFQRRAMASALVLADAGRKGFQHYADEIKRGGSASDIAATRLDNLSGDIALLKSQVETTLIKAGTPFQDMLRGWVQGLTNLVKWFASLPPGVQELILKILAIGGAVLIAAGAFSFMIGTLINAYRAFRDLQAGIKLAFTLFKGLSAGLLTNPVFLVIAAIVILVAIFVILFIKVKGFREFWIKVWKDVSGAAVAAYHAVLPALEAIGRFFTETLPRALAPVVGFFETIFNWIRSHWRGLGQILIAPFLVMAAPIIAAILLIVRNFNTIKDVVGAVAGFISSHWRGIAEAIVAPFVAAVSFIAGHFGGLITFVETVGRGFIRIFGNVVNWLKDHWQVVALIIAPFLGIIGPIVAIAAVIIANFSRIRSAVGPILAAIGRQLVLLGRWMQKNVLPVFQAFAQLVGAVFNRAKTAIQNAWGIIQPILRVLGEGLLIAFSVAATAVADLIPILEDFASVFVSVISAAVGVVRAVWQPAWALITTVVAVGLQTLRSAFSIFVAIVRAVWVPLWHILRDVVVNTWGPIKAIITGALKVIQGIFQVITGIIMLRWRTVWQGIKNIVAGVWVAIRGVVIGGINILRSIIVNGLTAIVNFFRTVPGRILAALGDMLSLLYRKGGDVIRGFWRGLQVLWHVALNFFKDVGPTILRFIGDLGNLLYDVGRKLIGGFVNGIKSAIGGVKDVLGGITHSLTSWKGPPEKDRQVLIPAGKAIIAGLIDGLKGSIELVKRTLGAFTNLFSDFLPKSLAKFMRSFRTGWDAIAEAVVAAYRKMAPIFKQVVEWFSGTNLAPLRRFGVAILNQFSGIGNSVREGLLRPLQTLTTSLNATIQRALTTISASLTRLTSALTAVSAVLNRGFGTGVRTLIATGSEMAQFASVFVAAVNQVAVVVRSTWVNLWPVMQRSMTTALTAIRAEFIGFVAAARTAWLPLWSQLASSSQAVWGGVRSTILSALRGVAAIIHTFVISLASEWLRLGAEVRAGFAGVWPAITAAMASGVENLRRVMQTALTTLIGLFRSLPRQVATSVGDMSALLTGQGREAVAGFLRGARSLLLEVAALFRGLQPTVIASVGNLAAVLVNEGRLLVVGLINGIRGALPQVAPALNLIVRLIAAWETRVSASAGLLVGVGQRIIGSLISGLQSSVAAIRNTLDTLTRPFSQVLPSAFAVFQRSFISGWNTIANTVLGAGRIIRPVLTSISEAIKGDLLGSLRALNATLSSSIQQSITVISASVRSLRPAFLSFESVFNTGFNAGLRSLSALAAALRNFDGVFVGTLTRLIASLRGSWAAVWQFMRAQMVAALAGLRNAFVGFATAVRSTWVPLWAALGSSARGVWGSIRSVVTAALRSIAAVIRGFVSSVRVDWVRLSTNIEQAFATAWPAVTATANTGMNALRRIIVSGMTAVVVFLRTIPAQIVRSLGDTLGLLNAKGQEVIRGFFSGIQSSWGTVVGFFGRVGPTLLGSIGNLSGLLYTAGRTIMQGLIDGIRSMFGPLGSTLDGVAPFVRAHKGPEEKDKRLLVNAGTLIMRGLTNGLSAGLPQVQRMLESTTRLFTKYQPTLTATVTPIGARGLTGIPVASGQSGDNIKVEIHIDRVDSPESAREIKKQILNPDVLAQITRSVKAGKRAS